MRILGALLLVALAAAALAGAWFYRDNPLTLRAQDYAETVAANSAASYVTLRSLNAFLSTAQEVEVGGSIFVSGTVQPLKVLEPVDDTVEMVSGAVFAVMVATGVVAVAMGPMGAVGLAMIAVALAIWALERLASPGRVRIGLSRRLIGYGAFLALAVPAAFVIAAASADMLTEAVWARNQAVLDDITASVAVPEAAQAGEDESGWFAGIPDSLGSIGDYRALAVNIAERSDALIQSLVMILAVFIFKLFVLPLMLLGGFFVATRAFVQARPGWRAEERAEAPRRGYRGAR